MKSSINGVDISSIDKWKDFEINRLFDIKSPAARTIKSYSEGEIPYVSSGSYNNGIVSFLEPKEGERLEKGNCITVSPLDGSAFYQEDNFLGRGGAGSAISLLYNENLTRYNSLFICTIIKLTATKFGYSDALTSDNLKTLKIKLPTQYKKDGTIKIDLEKKYSDEGYQPDWLGMGKYMEEREKQATYLLDKFQSINVAEEKPIDSSLWKEFPITRFFNLSLPKGDLQVKKVEDGDISLITPSNYNNGVLQKISSASNSTLYKANSLTVDMFGNAYYHDEDFFVTAHGHVNVLIPKEPINKYIGWFMASSIKKMFFYKYDFSDMCTQKVLKKEVIMLPATTTGEPDWQFMERYMRKIQQIASDKLNVLI